MKYKLWIRIEKKRYLFLYILYIFNIFNILSKFFASSIVKRRYKLKSWWKYKGYYEDIERINEIQ